MLLNDACNMTTHFFQFLGVLCHKRVQKMEKMPRAFWGQKNFLQKINLNEFQQKALFFYLLNHKFNVFKRFWKQKKKKFFSGIKIANQSTIWWQKWVFGHFCSDFRRGCVIWV